MNRRGGVILYSFLDKTLNLPFFSGIYQLPSRRLTDVSLLRSSQAVHREESGSDLSDVNVSVEVGDHGGVALSPMITSVCEQLLWDWKDSKSKRSVLRTTHFKEENSSEKIFDHRAPPLPG